MSRAATLRRWLLRGVLAAGLLFFYAPIVSVVLFSFNASTSATVWSGFSMRWYLELLDNDNILRAARLSLMIAAMSATGATILGNGRVAFILDVEKLSELAADGVSHAGSSSAACGNSMVAA